MKLLLSILRSHLKAIAFLFACVCCFCTVLFLYHINFEPVLYAAFFCLLAAVFLLWLEYIYAKRRLDTLCRLSDRILLGVDELPEPENPAEAEYQKMLLTLIDSRNTLSGEYGRKLHEMTDYYTLWAHQIKTPIAAMRLLLQSEDSPHSREASAELFRIEEYVEMVLGFLRLDGSVNDFVIRRCPLDTIIRQTARRYSKQFILKKISLDFRETGLTVLTDEKWLSFVIGQLISNALKYTETGKISVYSETDGILVIEDTGIGIAPEDLPRVCERGYTGYNGRTDNRSTGIGLYLCRRVLTKLGHTMRLESEPGRGTRVRLDLTSVGLEVE